MIKALVISSGGVDSTTCISLMIKKYGKENVSTISALYGQRHSKELECARAVADYYGLVHYELDLTHVFKGNKNCSLLPAESGVDITEKTYIEQYTKGKMVDENHVIPSYVPFRNGLFIAAAASFGMGLLDDGDELYLVLGNHKDDYTYADCSKAFIEAMNKATEQGTYGKVHVIAPINDLSKSEIVGMGLKLKTPYELTWSCYEGTKDACGRCASCLCRLEAFANNGVVDPIRYEQ